MRALLSLLLGGTLAFVVTACGATAEPAPTAGPAPTYSPPPKPSVVHIPAIDVTSNIVDLGLQENGEMETPGDTKLAPSDPVKHTGWYTSSPLPGRPGATVLGAHVDWRGEDGPFAKLDQLKPGDEITVESVDGAKVTFVVDRVETYPKDQFPHEKVYGDRPGPELVAITCGGSYDPAARSYRSNVVAYAKLKA